MVIGTHKESCWQNYLVRPEEDPDGQYTQLSNLVIPIS